ncbi:MAG: efflux RND transporter periplasmic adaptor subunit [Polyangiaceae bacterium]
MTSAATSREPPAPNVSSPTPPANASARGSAVREQRALERDLAAVEGGRKWLRRLITVLVLGGIVAAIVVYKIKTAPPPQPKYVLAQITEGDISETIQSTGQVRPVTEVQVGAQVSGRVTQVFVDFNDTVKKGQPLAEIDPTLIASQIDASQAQLTAALASVRRAEANAASALTRLDRAKSLFAGGVGSQADVDTAQGGYDVAVADVSAARAQVSQINAQLSSSKTNLGYTKILSPIDGVVINRAIDAGQTVAASFQAPVLFVLAQDLRKMRVFADIDEADVGRVREGMLADISVDAFPSVTFEGEVKQVRFSPLTTAGVVTYAAVLDVKNDDLRLRPGMTATVTIKSAHAGGVKRLPNSALRFHPSPPLDEKGNKVPEEPLPKLEPGKGRIYVVVDKKLGKEKIEPRIVDIGVSDGVYTELKSDLEGVDVVRDETDSANPQMKKKGLF